jgi:hypothetical protein
MEVTMKAGVGEITKGVCTPVLPGDDMFDLKRSEDVDLGKVAIFALPRRALPDFFPGGRVHH